MTDHLADRFARHHPLAAARRRRRPGHRAPAGSSGPRPTTGCPPAPGTEPWAASPSPLRPGSCAKRRRPRRWSRLAPMTPSTISSSTTGQAGHRVLALVAVREGVDREIGRDAGHVPAGGVAHGRSRQGAPPGPSRRSSVRAPVARSHPKTSTRRPSVTWSTKARASPTPTVVQPRSPPDQRRDPAGAVPVAGPRPGQRPHDTAAVERHPGQQAQPCEHEVQAARRRAVPHRCAAMAPPATPDDHRRGPALTPATISETTGPARAIASSSRGRDASIESRCQATHEPQLDGRGLHAAAASDQGVAQLVGRSPRPGTPARRRRR